MGKRVKALNTMGRIIYLVIFVLSFGVFYLTKTGDGWTDFILNCIFDLLAAGFLIGYFSGCARPLAKLTVALDKGARAIQAEPPEAEPKELWTKYGAAEHPFDNHALDERYNAYTKEMKRRLRQNPVTADCDIDDYIDEELVYTTVKKHYADQIGGIMTGLGILFTFIGLVYGLRSFDAQTVDTMQASTQALMAGIKVAFLTSIFGLIYSLIFSLFYKRLTKCALDSLYAFHDAYKERITPDNEQAGENYLIRLQIEQNANLKALASNIGQQVASTLTDMIGPAVERLEDTLRQYVTVSIEDQRAGMDKVVHYFVSSMNESLGGIFVELKERTEDLTTWEKNLVSATQKVLESINQTAVDLEKTRNYTQYIIEHMESFMEKTDSLTGRQMDALSKIDGYMTSYQQLHITEEQYIQGLAASQQEAAQNTQKALETAQAIRDMSQAYTQAVEHKAGQLLQSLRAQVELMGKDIKSNSDDSARQLSEANRQIGESAEALRAIAGRVTAGLETAAAKLEQATGNLDSSISEIADATFGEFNTNLTKLSTCVSEITMEVRASSSAVAQSMQGLPKTMSELDEGVRTASAALAEELNAIVSSVSAVRGQLEAARKTADGVTR